MSAHCLLIDSVWAARSSISFRSGALISRTSWLKNPALSSVADLGVQLFDLSLATSLGVPPGAGVEGPRRVFQKLLLPGVKLVRMDVVALRQVRDRRLFAHRLQAIFAFKPASILRLVFFVMGRSV
jgi:hypothetical protein